MKTLLLTLLLCIAAITAKAQYVTIPDTAFVAWLNNNGYSQCMNGNQMDTTCNAVVSATSLNIDYMMGLPLTDIEGVQYFDNVTTLYVRSSIQSLNSLPPNLKNFSLLGFGSGVTIFPTLPNTIENLYIQHFYGPIITELPSSLKRLTFSICIHLSLPYNILSEGLESLEIYDCSSLQHLPELPSTLRNLDIEGYSSLEDLPQIPASLDTLNFNASGNLNVIPTLPNGLKALTLNARKVNTISNLPNGLELFICNSDSLFSLPVLPNSIKRLNIAAPLTQLQNFPTEAEYIMITETQLTSLPSLPWFYIRACNVSNNPLLTCLPTIPSMLDFNFLGTQVSCVPNYAHILHGSTPDINTLPLCNLNNPNSCGALRNLNGVVYLDTMQNCEYDTLEKKLGAVKVELWRNGNLSQWMYTNNTGKYSFNIAMAGNYELRIDTSNLQFHSDCMPTYNLAVNVDTSTSASIKNDFGFVCNTGFDLAALSIVNSFVFRPGGVNTVDLSMGLLTDINCISEIEGSLVLTIDGPVSYVSSTNINMLPNYISGDTLKWDSLSFTEITSVVLVFKTDTFAQIGQEVCFTVQVSPTAGDNDSSNNTLIHCFPIVNSYDPNDKQVYPAGNIDTAQEWLTYTVRFQNTGNAEAQHVYLLDTLDENVEERTFQLLAASHENVTQLLPQRVVRFNFPNINLPDSTSDEPGSHGYVQYKVKLKEDLPLGTQISNTAYIYFDFNAPVITNTVTNTISEEADTVVIGIKERSKPFAVSIYPNPANQQLTVVTDKEISTIQIYNTQGTLLNTISTDKNTHTLNIADLPGSIYYIEVKANGLAARKRFVKL